MTFIEMVRTDGTSNYLTLPQEATEVIVPVNVAAFMMVWQGLDGTARVFIGVPQNAATSRMNINEIKAMQAE